MGNATDLSGYQTHLIYEIVKMTGTEGHTLEECTNLRNQIQDLIDNKLVQFNNAAKPNVITNLLPSKAMLWALAQESQIILKNIRAPGFDWEAC